MNDYNEIDNKNKIILLLSFCLSTDDFQKKMIFYANLLILKLSIYRENILLQFFTLSKYIIQPLNLIHLSALTII